jgi:thiol-disulfide isomerase/thioredoxin
MSDLSEDEEQKLNPPPKTYRVSRRVKAIFVAFAVVGLGVYGYMLIERRLTQGRFLMHQEVAPIKLMPSVMPSLLVIHPQTNNTENLGFAHGTFTLLNVWATWCPPCQKEMPSLARLATYFPDRLRIVALSIDDDVKAVTEFIDKKKLTITTLWDKDKQSLTHLGIEKYPETFLISPDGILLVQFSGPREWTSPQMIDYFLNVLK